jgi:hypothetical protein
MEIEEFIIIKETRQVTRTEVLNEILKKLISDKERKC